MQKLSVHLIFIKRCMQTKKGELQNLEMEIRTLEFQKFPQGCGWIGVQQVALQVLALAVTFLLVFTATGS